MPCTPSASMVFRSAWIPAPPPESEPAIASTRGGVFLMPARLAARQATRFAAGPWASRGYLRHAAGSLATERPATVLRFLPGERAEGARRTIEDAARRPAWRSQPGDDHSYLVRSRSRPWQRRATDDDTVRATAVPPGPPDALDLGSGQRELKRPVLQRVVADDHDHCHELTLVLRLLRVFDLDSRDRSHQRRKRIFMLGRRAAAAGLPRNYAALGRATACCRRREGEGGVRGGQRQRRGDHYADADGEPGRQQGTLEYSPVLR